MIWRNYPHLQHKAGWLRPCPLSCSAASPGAQRDTPSLPTLPRSYSESTPGGGESSPGTETHFTDCENWGQSQRTALRSWKLATGSATPPTPLPCDLVQCKPHLSGWTGPPKGSPHATQPLSLSKTASLCSNHPHTNMVHISSRLKMNIFISYYNSYLKTFFKGGRNSVLGLHPPLSHDHVVGSLVLRLVFDVTCLFIKL